MNYYHFPSEQTLEYHYTGKFEAPSPEWTHITRDLGDYELIVVTSGTLYIADHKQRYEVHSGEYLLMAPHLISTVMRRLTVLFTGCTFLHSGRRIPRPNRVSHCRLRVPFPSRNGFWSF